MERGPHRLFAGLEDVIAIGQLVKVLDCLPLAIELAAPRVRVLGTRALLARMKGRFDVLLAHAGRNDRQATLRAAFDWSWELLSEAEKGTLARLSVFEGGFTLESASAVVDLNAAPASVQVIDLVQWLVDKSSVRQVRDVRFDLLEACASTPASTCAPPEAFSKAARSAKRRRARGTGNSSRTSTRRPHSPTDAPISATSSLPVVPLPRQETGRLPSAASSGRGRSCA